MAFPDDNSPTEDEYSLSYYGGQRYLDVNFPCFVRKQNILKFYKITFDMREKNTDIHMCARKKADDLSLLLAYVAIRFDVAAKAGAGRC